MLPFLDLSIRMTTDTSSVNLLTSRAQLGVRVPLLASCTLGGGTERTKVGGDRHKQEGDLDPRKSFSKSAFPLGSSGASEQNCLVFT